MDLLIMGTRGAAAVSESSRRRFNPPNSLDTTESKKYRIDFKQASNKRPFYFTACDDHEAGPIVARRLDIGPRLTAAAFDLTDALQVYCETDNRRMHPPEAERPH